MIKGVEIKSRTEWVTVQQLPRCSLPTALIEHNQPERGAPVSAGKSLRLSRLSEVHMSCGGTRRAGGQPAPLTSSLVSLKVQLCFVLC